jgi:hypothetical protein
MNRKRINQPEITENEAPPLLNSEGRRFYFGLFPAAENPVFRHPKSVSVIHSPGQRLFADR